MVDESGPDAASRPAIGGDLILPALAVGLAAYFLIDIADLAWEAKANALAIASALLLLVAVQLVRIALRLLSGRASPAIGELAEPRALTTTRVGVVAMTGAFIVLLPWLGLTLGLFALVTAMMTLLRAGSRRRVLATASVVSLAAYLLFIALLNSRMPHGPFEKLMSALL